MNHESEPHDYQILTGFYRNGVEVTDAQIQREYLSRTERFIDDVVANKPDALIFLDKSARPVSWLVDGMWASAAPGVKKPQIYFLNIDREQWRDTVGSNSTYINTDRVDQNRIAELHALFAVKPVDDNKKGQVDPKAIEAPTIFDEKKVMIIDEVKATGDTLDIARGIFRRAFPKTQIIGKHWMIPEVKSVRGGGNANAEVPVWYDSESALGRGVHNRNPEKSAHSTNRAQRIGRWFLSRRFDEPDAKSEQLRKEMKWLAEDYQKIRP